LPDLQAQQQSVPCLLPDMGPTGVAQKVEEAYKMSLAKS
jgi:hypothetical protein